MREIGQIKLIQIQRSSLKAGERPHRYYDPTPLLEVDTLALSPSGIVGVTADGEQIIDVHNAEHPQTKNVGKNGISFGFTSHYREMRDKFGPHLTDGCAGENILIEAAQRFTLDDLGATIMVQRADGQLVELGQVIVAAPCVEFSHFAASQIERLPAELLKATLQFLDGGQRGFYARLADGQANAELRAGDRVFTRVGD